MGMQARLMLTKGPVPRLSDLNMWPAISGRKTQGTLEAHVNGLRFVSNKVRVVLVAVAVMVCCNYRLCVESVVVFLCILL